MIIRKTLVVLVIGLVFVSCSTIYTPAHVKLDPTVSVTETKQGNNAKVMVTVTDERESQSLGRASYVHGSGEIVSEQNVLGVIKRAVIEGLVQKDFDVRLKHSTSLTIELKLLEQVSSEGLYSDGVETRVAIKAVATREGRSYAKIYRANKDENYSILPSNKKREDMFNSVLGDVLTQLLGDQDLMLFFVL